MFFLIRHGERADHATPEEKAKIEIIGDVHLTEVGHDQAYKTGQELAKVFSQLKSADKIDEDAELCFVSSTLYRCLQTTRMLIEGSQSQPKNKTIYVETGIEEHFSNECTGVDENWRENSIRYYNLDKHPSFVQEVLSQYSHDHNSLFDYQKYPALIAKYGETDEDGAVRFQAVINNIGDLYKEEQQNPRKTVFVLCSHGISIESIYGYIHKDKKHFLPGFCSLNLFELVKETEEQEHFEVDPKIINCLAYQ